MSNSTAKICQIALQGYVKKHCKDMSNSTAKICQITLQRCVSLTLVLYLCSAVKAKYVVEEDDEMEDNDDGPLIANDGITEDNIATKITDISDDDSDLDSFKPAKET